MDACEDRLADIAKAMGLSSAAEVIGELYALINDLEIRCDLKSKGISAEVLDEMVESAAKVTRLLDNNPKHMSKNDILSIYKKLLERN